MAEACGKQGKVRGMNSPETPSFFWSVFARSWQRMLPPHRGAAAKVANV
jgi:hypothetical protein